MAPFGTILTSAVAATNPAARGFYYQDNPVRFVDHSINSGTFTVTDLSITAGQDPQNLNKVGDIHQTHLVDYTYVGINTRRTDYTPYPGFNFTVGRHKTSEVAKWWNDRIPPSKNTFGHTADALNFAFIGDMSLAVNGQCLGQANEFEASFSGIGLAQGSDSNGSNWWFGGQNCVHSGSNVATCHGTDQDGRKIEVVFQRGGKGQINDIYIVTCWYA